MKHYMVQTSDLEHNIRLILEKAQGKTVWAVVKGNGYGLGIVPMARILERNGIGHFAVTEVAEAEQLRQAGISGPILMLSATSNSDEIRRLLELETILTISSVPCARAVQEVAQSLGLGAQGHVKIDTGMGRYGFLPEQIGEMPSLYRDYPNLNLTGIYTHFYNSSLPEPTKAQFEKFQAVVGLLRDQEIDPGMVHCCNSSAFWNYPQMHCDGVRVGSGLLGRVTIGANTGLKVVGQCRAELEEIRTIPAGHTVGYAAGWQAKRETRIAILAIGYYHGFAVDRGFDLWRPKDCLRGVGRYVKALLTRKRLYVQVNGRSCPVLGHVGMINMVIDITDCDCQVGDWAEVNINPLLLKGIDVEYL